MRLGLLLLIFVVVGCPSSSTSNSSDGSTAASTVTTAVASQIQAVMDTTQDPCNNFYQYACGGYITSQAATLTSTTQSNYASATAGATVTQDLVTILSANLPVTGPFYQACVENTAAPATELASLLTWLQPFQQVTTVSQFMATLPLLHAQGIDVFITPSFSPAITTPKNIALQIAPGTLLLPVQNYLFSNANTTTQASQYTTLVSQVLALTPYATTVTAIQLLSFETQLASIIWSTPTSWSSNSLAGFKTMIATTTDYWDQYFNNMVPAAQVPMLSSGSNIQTSTSQYWQQLEQLLTATPVQTLVAYAYVLALISQQDVVNMGDGGGFNWTSTTATTPTSAQTGYCISLASNLLWRALGQYFLTVNVLPATITAALGVSNSVSSGVATVLKNASWLDASTQALTQIKLSGMAQQIGEPPAWPDYSSLQLSTTNYISNVLNTRIFNFVQDASQLGAPSVSGALPDLPSLMSWLSQYNYTTNAVDVYLGVLFSPTFQSTYPLSMQYGGLGSLIGNSMMHAFDTNGQDYDLNGNANLVSGQLSSFWTPASVTAYNTQSACLVSAYNNISVAAGQNVNGQQTLLENAADIGGLHAAWQAYSSQANNLSAASSVGTLSNQQLFFVAYAQNYCTASGTTALSNQLATDTHSPAQARVQGALAQTPQFAQAFSCPAGSLYNPPQRCNLW